MNIIRLIIQQYARIFLIIVSISTAIEMSYADSLDQVPEYQIRSSYHPPVNITKSPDHCVKHKQPSFLNGRSIKLMSWNNMAGCRHFFKNILALSYCPVASADNALLDFAKGQDLILIQEAYLDKTTEAVIKRLGDTYSWTMAVSYLVDKEQDIATGVLTIANARAQKSCTQKDNEPLLPTSKSILFSFYNILGIHQNMEQLMLVNIHAILMGKDNFTQQLKLMAIRIKQHKGPVILAGDFNTMTTISRALLMKTIKQLALHEVKLKETDDHRVRSAAGYYYDTIFYKNLSLLNAYSIDLKDSQYGYISDHNPVFAEFLLE